MSIVHLSLGPGQVHSTSASLLFGTGSGAWFKYLESGRQVIFFTAVPPCFHSPSVENQKLLLSLNAWLCALAGKHIQCCSYYNECVWCLTKKLNCGIRFFMALS